jgi:hypothetical protein
MNEDELKKIMYQEDQTWFTLSKLSAKTKIQESELQKVIKKSNLFVQSSSVTSEGENLFSTRDEFKENGSFASRVLGAFKNRID